MRVVVQRVSSASVKVDGSTVGAIDGGILALVGVGHDDTVEDAIALARKMAGLRIFPDESGRMNRDVIESGGRALVISQFTLLADVRRGRRPAFVGAADPAIASPLVDRVVEELERNGLDVESGVFGARMEVELVNDGPVTIIVETRGGRVI
jgi:D-tyrosyl-tRNA(Tyr) deacylase